MIVNTLKLVKFIILAQEDPPIY